MKQSLVLMLILSAVAWGVRARAQDDEDYLTDGEVSSLRDAQEPDKRMTLFMDFGQRRVDEVKHEMGSTKSDAGRNIQKILSE